MIRPKVLWFACVLAGIAVLLSASAPLEAGANSGHKIAVHVVTHGLACKSLPTFTECSQITTTYSGTGDIDVVPVFFDLSEYRVVEFGLTWPAEWGSCDYTKCTPTLDIGGITNPGDGMASAWTTCQTGWYVCPGYGWLSATGAGSVAIVPNTATEDCGVVDCAESPGPYYDRPESTFTAGIGGAAGGDPCGGGGRDGGEGDGGVDLPALRIARVIEVTDGSISFMQPVWSPDGTKLAFSRDPQFTGLYVRNADGTGSIRELTSAAYSGYKPVWASDSKGIVGRTRMGATGYCVTYIDVETGEQNVFERQADRAGQPVRNVYGDVMMDVDGQRRVLDETSGGLESTDGYYSARRPAGGDLRLEVDYEQHRSWVVDGDGVRRSEFPYPTLLADLSPTADRVAFTAGDGNLYVSRIDGSERVSLGISDSWEWSPDGRGLTYLSAIDEGEYAVLAAEIFVANADGSGVTQLTHTPQIVERFPTWSPDGMRIAYSTGRAGKICVAVLEEVR